MTNTGLVPVARPVNLPDLEQLEANHQLERRPSYLRGTRPSQPGGAHTIKASVVPVERERISGGTGRRASRPPGRPTAAVLRPGRGGEKRRMWDLEGGEIAELVRLFGINPNTVW